MRNGLVILASAFMVFAFNACGVKSKPLPPLEPAEIGRGAPTYKRAAEQAKPMSIPEASAPKASPTPGRER